jgi:hypothetical protein
MSLVGGGLVIASGSVIRVKKLPQVGKACRGIDSL